MPARALSRRLACLLGATCVAFALGATWTLFSAPEARSGDDAGLPAPAVWTDVIAGPFDLRWRLPREHHPDLVARMHRILRLTFPAWRAAEGRPEATCTGDLLDELRLLRDDPRAQRQLLDRFRAERRVAYDRLMPDVAELVFDGRLRGDDWDPSSDARDDGILLGKTYSLESVDTLPWSGLDGSKDVHQAAALYWADLDAIKDVENDYSSYLEHVDHSYEFIHAVPGSYLRGEDPAGRAFSTLRIAFQCDLPFPYGVYDCDLHILNTVDEDGHLVTDVYSTSADFYWLAGRDEFLPVRRSDGAWVATLAIRLYGFDIRNVPDGSDARDTALRSSLGNLKRRADALFRKRDSRAGSVAGSVAGTVPRFRVRGIGPTER